jgi:hypothetical protein
VKPHVIRNELGDGLSTLVPYGVSADVSAAARRLEAELERLSRTPSEPAPPARSAQRLRRPR